MHLHDKMLAKKRSCEAAMQIAMKEWKRELVEFKCPACGSEKIVARPDFAGKNPHWCPICHHSFDQPRDFVCDCPEPGSQSKCHDCPNFEKLMVAVKAVAEEVKSHDLSSNQSDSDS